MRSRQYRGLLVMAAVVGVVVSLACWCYLELVHYLQQEVYVDLPGQLGLSSTPVWWPFPWLLLAGLLIAVAVTRLPGHGGHEPSGGLHPTAPSGPADLPGVVLASGATLVLGLVLGPEAPLLAVGSGLALLLAGLSRREVPAQARAVLAAAGCFAALATIFGSPVIGTVIIIEAAGLGGATLPVVLLPGLVAAGIGSLCFIGIGRLTGLSTNAYALPPIHLPTYPVPQVIDFLWSVPLAVVAAILVIVVVEGGRRVQSVVVRRPLLLYPAAALLVGVVAVAFHAITGEPAYAILFSGEAEMSTVASSASTLSVATLCWLLVCKGVAWAVSLGAARGGPTFPGIFLGLVGGLLAAHLPGAAETAAVAVLIGASVVCVLRLPLSALVLALVLTQGGAGVAALTIVGVATAYLTALVVDGRRASRESRPRGRLPLVSRPRRGEA
jgi:H+/Cl- antiporter ClcA